VATHYTTALSARNRAPAANCLPDHSALLQTARQIERKYTTTPGLALAVAELISASIAEARR
jgi:hypothetical protein